MDDYTQRMNRKAPQPLRVTPVTGSHGRTPAPANPAPCATGLAPERLDADTEKKEQRLLDSFAGLDSLLVAFSGGADSAYLAWAAHRVLGGRCLAITAISPSFSAHDRAQATAFAQSQGLPHQFLETAEFDNPLYLANNADRCYHCKDELFLKMKALASARGFAAVAYGVNADDTHDFRPGHRAASEHRILTPLLDAGLHKPEIRALSRRAGLRTWDRPASACLSSRVPYGTEVTPELLARVEAGEAVLRRMGFSQFRVRAHGDLARIEVVPEEMDRALNPRAMRTMAAELRRAGFAYVTLDLEGYRQGSLNISLKK